MLIRTHFENREAWLAGRYAGLGASDAAAVVGKSPHMSNVDLWLQKTGAVLVKDISSDPYVQYGNRLEPAMRVMFAAEHPEMTLGYHQFDILAQSERPWLTATLDGELTDAKGRKGILEIKTAQVTNRAQWSNWAGKIPDNYYIQILHQFSSTMWDFAILYSKLVKLDGDSELRTYRFEREDYELDMAWLLEREECFWYENVLKGIQPALILPEL